MNSKTKSSIASFVVAISTLSTITLCLASCTSAQEPPAPQQAESKSKAPIDESGIPIIKVDQEHLQITEPGSKQTIYEMPESKEFIVDINGYKIKSLKELSGGKIANGEKIVQLVAGKDNMFDVPLADEQRIKVAPPFRLEKGKRLILAVGYKNVDEADGRIHIYPVWVGLIDVN